MCSQLRSYGLSITTASLALSAGNFVIGKATPTATPIHHKPIQVLVRQLLSLQVQYQEQFPYSTGGATQTNGEPMSYSQLRSHGLQQPLALSAGIL
jgi:hypothetical protein